MDNDVDVTRIRQGLVHSDGSTAEWQLRAISRRAHVVRRHVDVDSANRASGKLSHAVAESLGMGNYPKDNVDASDNFANTATTHDAREEQARQPQ